MNSSTMTFELLPNELIIECFRYFDAFDLFYSFDQLNSRFNQLLQTFPLYLNFEYAEKFKFDQFHKKIQSNLQIYSLHLSDENTCIALETFLSNVSLDQFLHLRSLTLTAIRPNILKKVQSIINRLSELKSFHLIDFEYDVITKLVSRICTKLETLTVPMFVWDLKYNQCISSLKHLTISVCTGWTLSDIFNSAPLLTYLNIDYFSEDTPLEGSRFDHISAVHLKQLIIKNCKFNSEIFEMIAKLIPNLKKLTLVNQDAQDFIDSYRWEHLITSSLPRLTSFKFIFLVRNKSDVWEKFQQFQSHFWVEQHHWYTESIFNKFNVCIYTIPYCLNTYELSLPPINSCKTFDNVSDLTVYAKALTVEYQYYFSNVTSLTLKDSTRNQDQIDKFSKVEYIQMLRTTVNLSNLIHLDISSYDILNTSSILLDILKQAPRLSSIKILPGRFADWYDNDELCKYLNKMIKKFDIYYNTWWSFEDFEQVEQFCKVFANIEQLICSLPNKAYLLFLIKNLTKLTHIQVSGWLFDVAAYWTIWFQENFPGFNVSFNITTDLWQTNRLRIWLERNASLQTIEEPIVRKTSNLSPQISVVSSQRSNSPPPPRFSKFLRRFLCVCSTKSRSSSSSKSKSLIENQ